VFLCEPLKPLLERDDLLIQLWHSAVPVWQS
jgi:hypothetical protein